MGVHPLGHDLDPAGREADRQRRDRRAASSARAWRCRPTANTALIGGPDDNSLVGAAWVFTRSGATWTQQGPKLTGSDETGAGEFGTSVALSADGNTALIGGPSDNDRLGAAWVFTRSGSTWTQQGAKLTGSGETGGGRVRLRAWRCRPTATPR